MSNVIDLEPLRVTVRRAAAKIGNAELAERFTRIATDYMIRDGRCFRPATPAELERAPSWARNAVARGEPVSVYKRSSALTARLNVVARRLADTRAVAAADWTKRTEAGPDILAAGLFLKKFDRVNFDTAARKALAFSRVLSSWRETDDASPSCDAQSLVLLSGQIWHRITSVAELRRIGGEFKNCLARTTSTGGYGASLKRGKAQFWVLRDLAGAGLIVAMAPAPLATFFQEVKGPSNARVRADAPALVQLGIALGVNPPPPEPPKPPRPPVMTIPIGILPAVLEARQPCRCSLCDPQLRLRLSRATP
ncbi:MAG: hypothetical protein JNL81_09650 [Hyphomonadaceae bacterium]|nr:hypothetical protein [Hyphomonadaceae bacterium]